MKHASLLLVTFLFLFSCKDKTNSQTKNAYGSDTTYLDLKGNKHRFFGMIPDSLRTPEQRKLLDLINEVTFKYMSVKDNRMVFTLTREQYLAKGIPERYYIILQQNLIDNNRFFEENDIKDVDKMLKRAKDGVTKSQ